MIELRTTDLRDGALVVEISGDLDFLTSPILEERLHEMVLPGLRWLVLDLSRVGIISSSGLRAFLVIDKRLREQGGRLRLAAPTADVLGFFGLAAVRSLMPVDLTVEEALSAIQS
jgi:anti-anti-sigma factor